MCVDYEIRQYVCSDKCKCSAKMTENLIIHDDNSKEFSLHVVFFSYPGDASMIAKELPDWKTFDTLINKGMHTLRALLRPAYFREHLTKVEN